MGLREQAMSYSTQIPMKKCSTWEKLLGEA